MVLGLTPMVAFDVFYQLWSHFKKLKMTRQDIRDEFKDQEGDPHVKGRIRQQQRAIARRRMMADVPKADVIVTNPTHYAVVLQYNDQKMSAPKVLAKGPARLRCASANWALNTASRCSRRRRWRARCIDTARLGNLSRPPCTPRSPRYWPGFTGCAAGDARAV